MVVTYSSSNLNTNDHLALRLLKRNELFLAKVRSLITDCKKVLSTIIKLLVNTEGLD